MEGSAVSLAGIAMERSVVIFIHEHSLPSRAVYYLKNAHLQLQLLTHYRTDDLYDLYELAHVAGGSRKASSIRFLGWICDINKQILHNTS